ncbi:MAG: chemotaxis protein CheR [Sulfuricurvum sp. PD_MW2]|jgi:chemotaxis protein methyltransferase CheR|uniref:CheR family methyltransferase n=1 Tax=Sulfuricurvum sp. PD_MW2 TaxID=2027917 RepID=UPI000C0669C5|nr:CheR family methyltransferase [Sulfuricurvum sp. PD_MW2]PHM17988.1 MAG: chemotaxis protein CheR [Sulfuricurvum sp. PD_MW2]
MFSWFKPKKKSVVERVIEKKVENFQNPRMVLERFTAITGIHFNQKESITASKLINFCRNHSLYSFEELSHAMVNNQKILEALINMLTVNETYFFRESRQIFYLVEKIVLSQKAVRILCAPGSTGEEPYSIVMALLDRDVSPDRIEVVSLDINSDVVALANKGLYSARSLHKTSPHLQVKYFAKEGEMFKISDEIKNLVSFHTLNIFDDALFALGSFDAIFSRNMLIYFDEPTVLRAVERLSRLAKDRQSLLFFGHADFVKTPSVLVEHYEEGVKFYTPH